MKSVAKTVYERVQPLGRETANSSIKRKHIVNVGTCPRLFHTAINTLKYTWRKREGVDGQSKAKAHGKAKVVSCRSWAYRYYGKISVIV